ncbi:MAG: amidohydrolase [Thalassobius sp.]|nr:amidohydrolase [Thalassovita sp.]
MKYILLPLILTCLLFSCAKKEEPVKDPGYIPLNYSLYFGDNKAGYFKSMKTEDGKFKYIFEYNDRGRGPYIEEVIQLRDNGMLESIRINGHNYLKDTVNERYQVKGMSAKWMSTSERGEYDLGGNEYFIGINSTIGNTEMMVRKMMESEDQSINLLPSGTAKLSNIEEIVIGDTLKLKLVEITGLSFKPEYAWFDQFNRIFALPSTWLSCIRDGYEPINEQLLEIQTQKEKDYYNKLARELTQKPSGKVIIKNVAVFDVATGKMLVNKSVVINGNTIEGILAEGDDLPEAAKVIDGTGKTLLPGLFDMHTHLGRSDGILNLAAGVTSVRDLANSFDLPEIRDEFNTDKVLGPRILIISGFIDQAGPYAGPIGKIIKTLDEGLAAVDFYKEKGYDQIKLYSSIDPSWVKPIAEKAHGLGMRVCGHIPAYMLAEDAVKAGYDEIQHINMIALNFMSDTIDTRTPLRFSMIGEQAANINIKGKEFQGFVKLLKEKNIVLDPTVSIFEGMLTTKAGEPDPQFEAILDRLPIQVKRGFYSGGLPIPKGKETQYKEGYNQLLNMINELHKQGITMVPGTDAMSGFALHKELENYVKAGISTADVLKMATLTSAEVIGVADKLGSIESGKEADLILVDGNPLENISDIRRVELTIKNGNLYNTADLYNAIGVKPFE